MQDPPVASEQYPSTLKNGTQDRATGWIKYGARWYNPTTGRWTQHDTLDAPLDPANANRYAYAANDPINNTDPLGLISQACVGTTVVALAAGASFIGAAGSIMAAPVSGGASTLATGPLIYSFMGSFGALIGTGLISEATCGE